jgi:hypothetical protein
VSTTYAAAAAPYPGGEPETPEEIHQYLEDLRRCAVRTPPTSVAEWKWLVSSLATARLYVLPQLGVEHKATVDAIEETVAGLNDICRAALNDEQLLRDAISQAMLNADQPALDDIDFDSLFTGSELTMVMFNLGGEAADRIILLSRALAGHGPNQRGGKFTPESTDLGDYDNFAPIIVDLPDYLLDSVQNTCDWTMSVPEPPAGTDRVEYAKLVLDLTQTGRDGMVAVSQAAAILAAE